MSKKTNKLPFILFLPVSIGIALIVSGIVMEDREDLFFAGICILFGGSFMVAIIIIFITVALESNSKTPTDQSKQEHADDVLSEARRRVDERLGDESSETRAALDKIADSVQQRKRDDRAATVFASLFIAAFLACAFTGVGLMAAQYILAGGIVFGCAPLMLITFFGVVKIKERVSLSDSKKIGENFDRKVGRVTRCTISSTVSGPVNTTTTYKIEFDVAGTPYTAYSREEYFPGDKLEVAVKRNGKRAKIIGRAEYSFIRNVNKPVVGKDYSYDIFDTENDELKITVKPSKTTVDKPTVGETEQQSAAFMDSVEKLRNAANIEDAEERREARTAARQAMVDRLNKYKAARAEAENKKKQGVKTVDAPEQPEDPTEQKPVQSTITTPAPTVSPTSDEPAELHAEQPAPPADEERSARTSSTHEKRAPVGYKGINRKK